MELSDSNKHTAAGLGYRSVDDIDSKKEVIRWIKNN